MKRKITILILLLTLSVTIYPSITTTLATNTTSSASPSANVSEGKESSAYIKTKLEELKKEIASKASHLKFVVSQKLQNKAYLGVIKSKSSSSLTIASVNGPKIININQDTQYTSQIKSKKKLTLEALKENDFVASLGDIDESKVLTAKKIVLLPTASYQPPTFSWGQIISIFSNQITIKNPSKTWILNLSESLKVQKGDTMVNIDSLKVNNFIIAVGEMDKNALKVNFIYIYK